MELHNRRRAGGFTLIELMIAVAIIGILASMAIPAYSNHVIKGKVQEGISALSQGRIKLEQYFQDNRKYTGGPCPAATSSFTYACSLQDASYTITATGIGNVANFVYTIDQNNAKKTTGVKSGWGTVPANCWITSPGASC